MAKLNPRVNFKRALILLLCIALVLCAASQGDVLALLVPVLVLFGMLVPALIMLVPESAIPQTVSFISPISSRGPPSLSFF